MIDLHHKVDLFIIDPDLKFGKVIVQKGNLLCMGSGSVSQPQP